MRDSQAQDEAEKMLQNFEIECDTLRCKDAVEFQNLISYVKYLLQFFPQKNGFRDMVYQCETRNCIEMINQSPLDINTDSLSIR